MSRGFSLFIIVALTLGVLAWRYVYLPRSGRTTVLAANTTALQTFLEEQRPHAWAAAPGSDLRPPKWRFERSFLTRQQVNAIFDLDPELHEYDPKTGFHHRPNQQRSIPLSEHPDSAYVLRTNDRGLREDLLVPRREYDYFLVCTGDEQTAGACNNSESFPNLLQVELEREYLSEQVEVWNAAVSGYCFYNYLGVLEKLLSGEPELFIVAFSSGNDFAEMIEVYHHMQGSFAPPRAHDYEQRMMDAAQETSTEIATAMHQAVTFKNHPEQLDPARQSSVEICRQILETCEEHGIQLLFVHVPPPIDYRSQSPEGWERAREILGLTNYDLAVSERLAGALIGELEEWGASVIDLSANFAQNRGEYYWRNQLLNLEGHATIARRLLPRIELLRGPRE